MPVSLQKNNEITKTYGDRDKFLMTFNPDVQQDICGDSDVCFFGGAPTLAQINATYGFQTAAMWLVPQLYNLSEYCGCKDKLLGRPLEECASVISKEFYYLSVSELMLFFHRFKSGRYGRFYGSIDPLVITNAIRMFLKERLFAYEEREKAEREKADREARDKAISWKEYCMKEYGELRKLTVPEFDSAEKPIPKEDPETIYGTAKWLCSETNKEIRETYGIVFVKKHGCTPEEYVKQYNTEKSHT